MQDHRKIEESDAVRVMTTILVLLAVFAYGLKSKASAGELVIVAEAEDSVIVVREPVKFSLLLTNESAHTMHLIEIADLGVDMEGFVLEVKKPDGNLEYRRTRLIASEPVPNPNYSGEPLKPGASIHVTLYPLITERYDPNSETFVHDSEGLTFEALGDYEVRFAYTPSKAFKRIWHPPGNLAFSNVITMRVLRPTREESAIIDAVWSGPTIAEGDYARGRYDQEALSRAISDLPDERMTAYAHFALSKHLASILTTDSWEKARDRLTQLRAELPSFRPEETGVQLSYVLVCLKDWSAAESVMKALLRQQPLLRNDYCVMQMYILATTRSFEDVQKWCDDRMDGRVPVIQGE